MSAIPVGRTEVLARPRIRARAATRTNSLLAVRTSVFFTVVALTYVVGSLSGQVLLEKARRESLQSLARAQEARQAEAVLQHQVDGLLSLDSIAGWARANGFIAPDAAQAVPQASPKQSHANKTN
ncbi:MAG: hypothetical protein HZC36_12450 [Armatimonadetes bacterium]|nr:hypothetical protein [Armatimonadota bacterium]